MTWNDSDLPWNNEFRISWLSSVKKTEKVEECWTDRIAEASRWRKTRKLNNANHCWLLYNVYQKQKNLTTKAVVVFKKNGNMFHSSSLKDIWYLLYWLRERSRMSGYSGYWPRSSSYFFIFIYLLFFLHIYQWYETGHNKLRLSCLKIGERYTSNEVESSR